MDNAQLINQFSGKTDWRTPLKITDAARAAMGSIMLDPASSALANSTVMAATYYTQDQDGLSKPWYGNIWLNHPFGIAERACGKDCKKKICKKRGYHLHEDSPGTPGWTNKLLQEYRDGHIEQACSISFVSTSEKWFKPLLSFPICFLHGRLNYLLPDGSESGGSTKGSCVVYLGPNVGQFVTAFMGLGQTMIPYVGHRALSNRERKDKRERIKAEIQKVRA